MKVTDEYTDKMGILSPKTTKTEMSKSAKSPGPYIINVATQNNNNKKMFVQLLQRNLKKQKKKYFHRMNTSEILVNT